MAALAGAAACLSFRELFSHAKEDPYHGDYADVMAAYQAPVTAPLVGWSATNKLTPCIRMGSNVCNAYVGLFTSATDPIGPTRLLHSPRIYPTYPGRVTPFDNRAYGILDDVVGAGSATPVNFNHCLFTVMDRPVRIDSLNDAVTIWGADATMQLMPPLDTGEGTRVQSCKLMYVPARYTPLFLHDGPLPVALEHLPDHQQDQF